MSVTPKPVSKAYYDAITKLMHTIRSAFTEEDMIEIFHGGIDVRHTLVQNEWRTTSK